MILNVYYGYRLVRRRLELKKVRRAIKENGTSVAEAPDRVGTAFRKLAEAAALDPGRIRILVTPDMTIPASSYGQGAFTVCELLETLGNPCLLWGIVAHEIAHESLGHMDATTRFRDVQDIVRVVLGAPDIFPIPRLALRAYERSQEREADAKAVELLEAAGQPRWQLRYALEFMLDAFGDSGGEWFSIHPLTSDRIATQPEIEQTVATSYVTAEERERQILHVKLLMNSHGTSARASGTGAGSAAI